MKTTWPENWDEGLQRAVSAVRNLSEFSRRVGTSRSGVYTWKRVPGDLVRKVEAATGVPAHELRPDIFEGYRREPEPQREGVG